VEALGRFGIRPRRSPDLWFAEASSVGMGTDLELAAAGKALSYVEDVPAGMYLSVNLSPTTLVSPRLPAMLTKYPRDQVVLEITEHSRVDDYDELKRHLARLRAQGLRFAIDDVGAGFSSLRHVVALRPDFIKLDIALTLGVERDNVRTALVATMVSFAQRASTTVIAEGIETRAQLEVLRQLGVEYGQGFLLGRPGPMPDWQPTDGRRWPGRASLGGDQASRSLRAVR
jgi:EAL domain-containing protein (putative c-di-GMP-specific phosphodiesterase class I)